MSSDSEDDFYDNVTERLQKEKDKIQEEKTETENLFDDSGVLDEIVKNNKFPPKNKRKNTRKIAEDNLQKEIDKVQKEETETENLFDDSGVLDEIVKNNKLPPTNKRKSSEETAGSSVSDLPDVSVDNVEKTTSKRMTRSRAKCSNIDVTADVELPPPRSKRQKSNPSVSEPRPKDDPPTEASPDTPGTSRARGRARGRGRGTPRSRGWGTPRSRGRRGRNWNRYLISEFLAAVMAPTLQQNAWDPSIPTFSIGNTSEYPDQLHEQPLFSNSNKQKPEDVVVIEDENIDEDNEELSVKVYWQNSEIFKFTIRKFQKLTQIFDYFAKKENVTQDKLLFMYNEKILTPDDTPDAIDYSIVKFIDGGIVTQGVKDLLPKINQNIKGGIKIKFQCQNVKKPFEITIQPDDKLSSAMMQCSEHLEKPLDKLKFEFDGDSITGKTTARELEFEGGECIDVRILS